HKPFGRGGGNVAAFLVIADQSCCPVLDNGSCLQTMLTARALSQMASELYPSGPPLFRALQVYRPYICPFEALISEVPKDATVLDIGCGGGLFLGLLDAAGRRPDAIG